PFAGTIKDGETVKIECLDWTGGQIGNNDSADDVLNIDLTRVHYLTGPFEVVGARPGDMLLIEIMDVQPFQDQPWGFTGIFDRANGGGFLDEIYPSAAKAIWDFEGISCSSRHVPHVKFAGLIHPGILGCAPSEEVLATWNRREGELVAANKLERTVALMPEPKSVHAGSAGSSLKEKVGKEGARTIPGRPEHGGNCDIKNLSRGSKVYLPVHVEGAKFSVGDLHFSQGDGEISFCGAIEMAGVITVNFKVVKNGMADLGLKSPIYLPGPVEPQFGPGRYIYFEGFSVDEHGKQHYMDVTVAYRQTSLRCIEYLRRFGYSDYQSYLLLSCAPVQGHIAGIVDIPNACTTLGLPVDIFDFDAMPTGRAKKLDMGSCAFETAATEGKVTKGGENSRVKAIRAIRVSIQWDIPPNRHYSAKAAHQKSHACARSKTSPIAAKSILDFPREPAFSSVGFDPMPPTAAVGVSAPAKSFPLCVMVWSENTIEESPGASLKVGSMVAVSRARDASTVIVDKCSERDWSLSSRLPVLSPPLGYMTKWGLLDQMSLWLHTQRTIVHSGRQQHLVETTPSLVSAKSMCVGFNDTIVVESYKNGALGASFDANLILTVPQSIIEAPSSGASGGSHDYF
ncbi:putative formamidase, partial [Zalerion maritima]